MRIRILGEAEAGLSDPRQLEAAVVLVVSPLLMVTWWYYGDPRWLAQALPEAAILWGDRAATSALGSFVAAFLLLGLVPALLVRFGFRRRLADYGVQWGDRVRTPRAIAWLCPAFVAAGYVSSTIPAVQQYYPINPSAGASPGMFAAHALGYLLFYLGWEFHFRGFLQFGLRNRFGEVNAVLVQVLASVLLHVGRPASETYASMLVGLLWGALAFRTRSLIPGLLQHYCLGISLDWFLCFGRL